MVAGVMIFPKIIPDRSAALMRVQTTYFSGNNSYFKLDLPDTMACKNKTACWVVNSPTCRQTLSLMLCQKRPHMVQNPCIHQILTEDKPSTQCDWLVASAPEPEVLQFEGGVMLSSTKLAGEVLVLQNDELISHGPVSPSESPQVLSAEDGDYLQYNGQLFQLRTTSMQVGYEIRGNITLPVLHENLGSLQVEGWVSEEKIPILKEEPWVPPRHYTWWILVTLGLIIIIIIFVIVR